MSNAFCTMFSIIFCQFDISFVFDLLYVITHSVNYVAMVLEGHGQYYNLNNVLCIVIMINIIIMNIVLYIILTDS